MTGTAKTGLAKGSRLSGRRSLAVATAIVLTIVAMGLPVIAQEHPLSAWRLDEWGKWTGLPAVNPYATITGLGSSQGWGNAGASIGITARAVFEPDLSRAEISAEFVPVSRAIIASDSRLFIAPLGQRLEWKVIVTVRNPNDVSMTNVRVHNQFGKAFRAALTGQSVGDARMADADVKGLLPSSSGFTWDIGYLGPGDAAKAELTVTTNQSAGRAEFAEEGVYSLDTGFQLTYRLLGKDEVRNTAPCSVIARRNPSALRSDGEPYGVVQKPIERDLVLPERPISHGPVPVRPGAEKPIVIEPHSQQGPAVTRRVAPELSAEELGQLEAEVAQGYATKNVIRDDDISRFTVTATASEGNITEEGGKFVVPVGEYVEWVVDLKVHNPFFVAYWYYWSARLEFGPGLDVECLTRSTNSSVTVTPELERTVVTWRNCGNLDEYESAEAKLKVSTRNPAHYSTSGEFPLVQNMQLQYDGIWLLVVPIAGHVCLQPIYVIAKAEPKASVSASATRLDWRVRKPGTYAALATEITATGSGRLQVQFSGFRDLARTDGIAGTIAAFYGFGDDLAAVETGGWVSAADLNNQTRYIYLSHPAPLLMWSKISVGEEVSSAEYESKGVITFIVSNNWEGEGT